MEPLLKSASKAQVELDLLLAKIEPQIKRAFMEVILKLREPRSLKKIMELLREGKVEEASVFLQKSITSFASTTVSYYSVAGQVAASTLSGLIDIAISFDQTNFRAVRIMQEARLRLISEMNADQIKAIREVLIGGIASGTNPTNLSKELKVSIGLSHSQVKAVANYRRLLELNTSESLRRELRDRRFDRTIRSAISGEKILTTAQIDRMVERYADRQLKYRAETIARTEALRAVHLANQEVFMQAIDAGDLDADTLTQTWVTAKDERVRGSHASMNGQKKKFGEKFISGNGYLLAHPGDPSAPGSEVINCRCILTIRKE